MILFKIFSYKLVYLTLFSIDNVYIFSHNNSLENNWKYTILAHLYTTGGKDNSHKRCLKHSDHDCP